MDTKNDTKETCYNEIGQSAQNIDTISLLDNMIGSIHVII